MVRGREQFVRSTGPGAPGGKERGNQRMECTEADYIVVQALEDGVSVIGLARGRDTRLQHTEKLSTGEILVAQFTSDVSAVKISGKAKVLTRHGQLEAL